MPLNAPPNAPAAADPAMLQLPYGSLNQNHRRTRGLWLEHLRQSLLTPGIGENTSLNFE
jgi:hypothetical protein